MPTNNLKILKIPTRHDYAKIPTHYLSLPKIPLSFEDPVSLSSRFLSVSRPSSPVLAQFPSSSCYFLKICTQIKNITQ